MKICPQCNATYSDDTLNFCLEDGSVLTHPQSNEPPPTVMVAAPSTSPPRSPFEQKTMHSEVPTAPSITPPKRKSSKAWILVIGMLFAVIAVCGGGFVGILLFVPDEPVERASNTDRTDKKTPKSKSKGDPDRRLEKEDDLKDWIINENKYISSEYKNGALEMTSVDKFYYVVLSSSFKTYEASTLLTVANPTGKTADSGYGLVFHSYPTGVLEKDYAFLIRSDNGTYRIVQHTKKKERVLVEWTKSDAIERGKSENDLEVRTDGREMSFYINGEFVKKLTDYVNYKDGVAGIYTSDDIPIAFSKLEIRK